MGFSTINAKSITLTILGFIGVLLFSSPQFIFGNFSFQKKPVVMETEDYILTINNYYGKKSDVLIRGENVGFGPSFVSPISFQCLDNSNPRFFAIFFMPLSGYADSQAQMLQEGFYGNINKKMYGENEFIQVSDSRYHLFTPNMVIGVSFYSDCGGAFELDSKEKEHVLSGLSFVSKKQTVDDKKYFEAYVKYIKNKIEKGKNTPSECFAEADKDNPIEQKICQNLTEGIYTSAISKVSYAHSRGIITDEISCKQYIANFSEEERDTMISEFDYKGTQSVCASVYSWTRL